jgi:hypothetical protein
VGQSGDPSNRRWPKVGQAEGVRAIFKGQVKNEDSTPHSKGADIHILDILNDGFIDEFHGLVNVFIFNLSLKKIPSIKKDPD